MPTVLSETTTLPTSLFHFYKNNSTGMIDVSTAAGLDGDDSTEFRDPVEAPTSWSGQSVRIVVDKYLLPCDENSIVKMVRRVAHRIATFNPKRFEEFMGVEAFEEALVDVVLSQKASWNSPVWFNVGNPQQVAKGDEQAWACLILGVDDYMQPKDGPESIEGGWVTEGETFRLGSGSGVNLSRIRAKGEPLSGGTGSGSGPVSLWMRPTDAIAGVVSSGGRTRRAAKMVIMDADHPDIFEFVNLKSKENKRGFDLQKLGYSISLNGADAEGLDFQNANNSIRVTDDFMRRVENDDEWPLTGRVSSLINKTVRARDLWEQVGEAAAYCADPGVQYHDEINRWNTVANDGEITASNPCSEYMFLNNTVCNLASINVWKFVNFETGVFDIEGFKSTVQLMIESMDVLCDISSYVTPHVRETALKYRTLGLGTTNLGAVLMGLGIGYDTAEGRAFAGGLHSLLQATAYDESAFLASRLGTYERFEANREPHLRVLQQHAEATTKISRRNHFGDAHPIISSMIDAAEDQWVETLRHADESGLRNAQVSVIAPTGTISFMMGAETTGIEPVFSMNTVKELVGGGKMELKLDECVRLGLQYVKRIGIRPDGDDDMVLLASLPMFATAVGQNALSPEAHVDMVCAIQPFISGAISKTINLPEGSTAADVLRAYERGWAQGAKALAVYVDNSKPFQPLTDSSQEKSDVAVSNVVGRSKMAGTRAGVTHKFTVAGEHDYYLTVNFFDDGAVGEIFLSGGKEGTAFTGMMGMWAIACSMALQSGIEFDDLKEKFFFQTFDPMGHVMSDSPIKFCKSIPDYVFHWIDWYTSTNKRAATEVTTQVISTMKNEVEVGVKAARKGAGLECPQCKSLEYRQAGTCWECRACLYSDGGCG